MLNNILFKLDDTPKIEIRSSLCGHIYSNKFSCNLCAENCPTQGLKWQDNAWQIEECNYCGKCVTICPSHVFKLDEDSLMQKCQLNQQSILTCDVLLENLADVDDSAVVNIPCLNQLYPELLIYLIAKQNRLNIYLEPEKCTQCVGFNLEKLIDDMQAIGDFQDHINWIKSREDLPDLSIVNEEAIMDRRAFLGTMFRRGKRLSMEVINEAINDYNRLFTEINNQNNAKLKEKPEKRLRLLMALQLFNQKSLPYGIEELPYHYMHAENCELCGFCVQLCPSDALEIKESEGSKSLHYWPLKCNGCGLCQDACIIGKVTWGKAMQLEDLIKKKGEILVVEAKADKCNICKEETFFYPEGGEHNCYACRLRSKMPDTANPFKRWKFDSA